VIRAGQNANIVSTDDSERVDHRKSDTHVHFGKTTLFGGDLMVAAQANVQIEAEIGKKTISGWKLLINA